MAKKRPTPSAASAPQNFTSRSDGSRQVAKAAPQVRRNARRRQAADSLNVVMVASEMHPFATTGGLAEVMNALPSALARLGHNITVILPRYRRVATATTTAETGGGSGATVQPEPDVRAVLDFGGREQSVGFYRVSASSGVTAVFVDLPGLFDREGLYGDHAGDYADNGYRFALFSRAALEYVRLIGERPSVIHGHDWQAGLVPVYQKMLFSEDPVLGQVPVVFTVHNLAFQGLFPAESFSVLGLPRDLLDIQGMEFYGWISYLKGGINFSERVTTVSPGYAREILMPPMGFGFEGVLTRRAGDLSGILNGIDTERWNPATDPFLPAHYDAEDLSGKSAVKRFLLQTVNLDGSDSGMRRPLIGLVSRLTDQKGFDLLASATDELMTLDAAWVMLGNGEQRYEEGWKSLAARYPGRVSARIGYDERMEHLIEAGADAFLMPSRFEPCGLNQLNSLRYGTLPIVRATGGLDDTVEDMTIDGGGTGFKFVDYTPAALLGAVSRALDAYRRPDLWRKMQHNAMRKDYSWDVSAREYVKVYRANS